VAYLSFLFPYPSLIVSQSIPNMARASSLSYPSGQPDRQMVSGAIWTEKNASFNHSNGRGAASINCGIVTSNDFLIGSVNCSGRLQIWTMGSRVEPLVAVWGWTPTSFKLWLHIVVKVTAGANFFCFVINVHLLRMHRLLKSENAPQQWFIYEHNSDADFCRQIRQ